MRKYIIHFILVLFGVVYLKAEADPNTVNLARAFGRDIFELNGVPYLQPLVETLNATSNSRFFNQAYVPQKVDEPYFRIGAHAMLGFVRNDMKTYNPAMPAEPLDLGKLSQYFDIFNYTIKDTAGLMYYALKTILYDGIQKGMINVPKTSATILGRQDAVFDLPHKILDSLVRTMSVGGIEIFPKLPKDFQDSLINTIWRFPETFTLPPGADMNTIFAAVPQFEIGALFGTEMLLRFIPPVNMGENIGDFAFWGIGLKHSVSQYFEERYFDLAVQVVYQGTNLKNKVGVTNSDLRADGTFWDFNIHASKAFLDDQLNIYAGLSYELFNINSNFTYFIPIETQLKLGLRYGEWTHPNGSEDSVFVLYDPTPDFPGDTLPQTSNLRITNTNIKFVFGLVYQIGPVAIFLDYNISKFNIFTGGIEVRF
ncbi:MAG: hypothetical protein A2X61_09135 [Ignavibacteria bacterium GWB2_35_12]|nr:MAG: hypothetical protein A2X63_09935 [Ignavibacteria bacterium GWA2_35_8]OGU39375.1 MAG: hypothetical protein A2X61_09135 [Ignavibacteria bacterium GWB2_35_12]OGU92277.1 MAG: hypothetical protein A2220_05515 [Ignavibacteria bacterium RIFOXYA2_FULL_35_10]OGV21077.1 MAG: hypothetical protein A2475_00640 [Ignavibacteria bacterium RIFOXYC2_FULL_35_21]